MRSKVGNNGGLIWYVVEGRGIGEPNIQVNYRGYMMPRDKYGQNLLALILSILVIFNIFHDNIFSLIISKVMICSLGPFSYRRVVLHIKVGEFMEGLRFIIKPWIMETITISRARGWGVDGKREGFNGGWANGFREIIFL